VIYVKESSPSVVASTIAENRTAPIGIVGSDSEDGGFHKSSIEIYPA